MSWINKDNLRNLIKKTTKRISGMSIFKDVVIFIAGIVGISAYLTLILGVICLCIWLIISFFYYFWLPLPALILEGIFNIRSNSNAESAIIGTIIWLAICLIIAVISWIFTGRPPLVSILFRIICLLGVGIGITLLVNKYIIIDALQYSSTLLHEFILKVSSEQTEDKRVLSVHILESLRYFDTLIHSLIDILPKNPLQLIGISISLGFLSKLSSGIRNKNVITINTASAEKDKNDK